MIRRIVLGLSLAVFGVGSLFGAFPDVPLDHWSYDAVEYLASKGYVQGYPDGEFKGDNTLTRYEWALIVARLDRDLTLRFADVEGGMPGDVSSIMADLREEFAAELDLIREMIAANEIRIDALSGDILDVQEALATLEGRLDNMPAGGDGGIDWYVNMGIMALAQSGDNTGTLLSDTDAAFAGTLEVGATHRAGDWFFAFSLAPQDTTDMWGAFSGSKVTYCNAGNAPAGYFCNPAGDTLVGPVTPFRRGGTWVNFSNSAVMTSGNQGSSDITFDLHEAYTIWNGRNGDGTGVDIGVGRFEPFWSPSDLFWNSQVSVEGIAAAGKITDSIKWAGGYLTARTSAPPAGFDDPIVFAALYSDELIQGVDLYLGWSEAQGSGSGVLDNPQIISGHLTFPFIMPGDGSDFEFFVGYMENREAPSPFEDNAWEAGLRGPVNDWQAEVAFRKIGLGVGHHGAWVPDSEFWTLDITRDLGDGVDFTLAASLGTLGEDFASTALDRWHVGAIIETSFGVG
ncbi:S-layer homology domain-containing protein [bacterium]|nr:S-layer homology domain-containing protein [bacterium]